MNTYTCTDTQEVIIWRWEVGDSWSKKKENGAYQGRERVNWLIGGNCFVLRTSQACDADIITSILQRRKPRHRRVRKLAPTWHVCLATELGFESRSVRLQTSSCHRMPILLLTYLVLFIFVKIHSKGLAPRSTRDSQLCVLKTLYPLHTEMRLATMILLKVLIWSVQSFKIWSRSLARATRHLGNPLSGDRSSLHTVTNFPRAHIACSLVTCGKV